MNGERRTTVCGRWETALLQGRLFAWKEAVHAEVENPAVL
jgi:hypothetical protein